MLTVTLGPLVIVDPTFSKSYIGLSNVWNVPLLDSGTFWVSKYPMAGQLDHWLSNSQCYVLEPFYSYFLFYPMLTFSLQLMVTHSCWLMWPPTIQTCDSVCSHVSIVVVTYCSMWPIITCDGLMTRWLMTLLFCCRLHRWCHRLNSDYCWHGPLCRYYVSLDD